MLSGAAGATLVSFVMTAEALAGVPWNVPVVVAVAAALAFGLRPLMAGTPSPGPISGDGERRWAAAAAHVLAVLAVLAALAATRGGAATSPDLVFFWGTKAERFALSRTFEAEFIREPSFQYMNFVFPPLVTNVFALATMAAGRLPWTAAAATFPLLLAALALGLPGLLRPTAGRASAAAFSALAAAALAYAGMENDIAGNGDMALAVFETLAAALLVSPLAAETPMQWLAGLLLSGAAASKIEGLPFAVAAAGAFAAVRGRESGGAVRSLLRLLLPAALTLGAWFAFGATRGLFLGYSGYARLLELHFDRLPAILEGAGRALAESGHALPWLVPIACLLLAGRRARSSAVPLTAGAALVGFAIFTYLHFGQDLEEWISWSAARLLAPVAVMAVIAAACGGPSRPPRREPLPSPG